MLPTAATAPIRHWGRREKLMKLVLHVPMPGGIRPASVKVASLFPHGPLPGRYAGAHDPRACLASLSEREEAYVPRHQEGK